MRNGIPGFISFPDRCERRPPDAEERGACGGRLAVGACARTAADEPRGDRERPRLNFAGNAEGRDLLAGAADVLVTDGFTGNVALKVTEGTIKSILEGLREEITATAAGKLGGLLIRPSARRLRERLDPDTYGGAYLLGLRGLAVIAHGNSSRRAITNAIRLAARGVEKDVVGRLSQNLGESVLASRPSTTPTPNVR